jgi:hypothetical protein
MSTGRAKYGMIKRKTQVAAREQPEDKEMSKETSLRANEQFAYVNQWGIQVTCVDESEWADDGDLILDFSSKGTEEEMMSADESLFEEEEKEVVVREIEEKEELPAYDSSTYGEAQIGQGYSSDEFLVESSLINAYFQKKQDSEEVIRETLSEWGIEEQEYYIKEWKTTDGPRYQPMLRMLGGKMRRRRKHVKVKRKPLRRVPQRKLYQAGRVVPTTPVLMPDEFPIKLKWRQDGVMMGAASIATRVHTNALFDVDPALGGWTVNGFTTYSRLYNFNRVVRCTVIVDISNMEASAVRLNFIHTNTDPGTSPSSYLNWSQSQYGYTKLLGPASGSSNFRYHRTIDPRRLVGDRLQQTSERYVGSATANPTDTTFFGFMVENSTGSTMSNGIAFTIQLILWCQFFDRKVVDEMFSPPPQPRLLVRTTSSEKLVPGKPSDRRDKI